MSKSNKIGVLHVAKYSDGNDRLCRHNCLFCMERIEPNQSNEKLPSTYDIESTLEYYFAEGVVFSQIYIAGGEPTLRRDFFELVELARKYCSNIVLSTACDYDDADKVIKQIVDLGIRRVATSIHGCNEETHDYLTGSPGSFNRSLGSIRRLLKKGISVSVNFVVNAFNVDEMAQIIKMFPNAGLQIEKLTLTHYLNHGNAYYHNELRFNADDCADIISAAIDIAEKVNYEVRFRDFPLCLDMRLVHYREVLDNIYILDLSGKRTAPSEERAPSFSKDKCETCVLFKECTKYLLANYGEI